MIDHLCNAYAYECFYEEIQRRHGEDVYPLLFDFNIDAAVMDGASKVKVRPSKISLKNLKCCKGQELNSVITVAYAPEIDVSDDELFKLLESAIPRLGSRVEAMSYLKRYVYPC